MSVNTHQNIVSPSEIDILLEYFDHGEGNFDQRPDITTRSPHDINGNDWPRDLVADILDRVLDDPHDMEYAIFIDLKHSFGLHADTGDGDQTKLHKNILIPLQCEGVGSTVIFENKWYGPKTRFTKVKDNLFSYSLPKKDGKFYFVDDIREIRDISDFNVTQEELEELIFKRSTAFKKPPEPRNTDYSLIEGYDPTLRFDEEFHKKWLSHVPLENLHGLTVKEVVLGNVGDVITWDRQHIHCVGSSHQRKKGLGVFTTKR